MLFANFLRSLGGSLGLWSRPLKLEGLPTEAETQLLLQRERQRADRTNDPLALVVFQPQLGSEAVILPALVGTLRGRLRTTDVLGWVEQDISLAVILPHTSMEGARKVCHDTLVALPTDQPLPGCSVFLYPPPPTDSNTLGEIGDVPVQPASLEPLLVKPTGSLKRLLDILGSSVGLLLLSPLLLLIALLIKLTSRGPIFFCQKRSGLGGQPFWMYKFRTMVVDAEKRKADLAATNEQDGPAFKMKNDPRVTWIGRILRRTSLDELPQLWNVLRGDMSLVGPRPLPCSETDASEPWHRQRLAVVPGLTCIWQVRGRSRVSFADWMRMDLHYVRSASLKQDLQLMLMTVPAVLMQRGAH